jgi:mannan endo-1,4-beta-mannosidase
MLKIIFFVSIILLSFSNVFSASFRREALSTLSFLNGINLQPSYYNNGNVTFGWDLMKSYSKIKTVRIEIEPTKVQAAVTWILEARNNGYFVIATYHDCTKLGSDDPNVVYEAGKWWQANYETISGGNPNNFVVNLINEWGSHSLSSDAYASAYNSAIGLVRTVYYGPIIIDLPGWGQEPQTAIAASKSITDQNVILSAHIYPGAWNSQKNRYFNIDDISEMNNSGRPCMIGEFGTITDGAADVQSVVNVAKSLQWPVLGWAWNGDGEAMNMESPSWSSYPQAPSYDINGNYFYEVYNLL